MNSIAGYISDHEKIKKPSVLFSFILCFIFFFIGFQRTKDPLHIYFFSEKIIIDTSCESSAYQMIHIKYQVLFS